MAGLALLLAVAQAVAAPIRPVPAPSDAAVEAMLAAPADEIFALEAALPQIREPSLALLAQARLAAARLDAAQARRLVDRFLAGGERSPRQRALAWGIAADAAFATGDYARAAKAARQWQAALAQAGSGKAEQEGAAQTAAVAAQLAAAPAQRVVSYRPRPEPVHRDKVGLPRSTVTIGGIAQEAVLDTGANLSVVSLSAARRLGLRLQGGAASVGSASRAAVATRLGVADTLRFAGLTLRNVAFLVLDDEQLAMPVPGGYRIDAILGFPVLRELRRFRITAAGRLEPSLPDAPMPGAAPGNLRLIGNDLFVQAEVGGQPAAMHLDSGGARSSLSATFARRHADLLKGLRQRREHVAGAGGAVERSAATWPGARVRIGSHETVLAGLAVELAGGTGASPSVLGEDVLGAFDWWSVDFARMELEFGPARTRAKHAPAVPSAGTSYAD
ncbi:hypothetical protein ASG87_18540 [Frateuria sp. Soil773]|nr:hypothetical protein ASG87_18540 [Frateuria sp. Soil773]